MTANIFNRIPKWECIICPPTIRHNGSTRQNILLHNGQQGSSISTFHRHKKAFLSSSIYATEYPLFTYRPSAVIFASGKDALVIFDCHARTSKLHRIVDKMLCAKLNLTCQKKYHAGSILFYGTVFHTAIPSHLCHPD